MTKIKLCGLSRPQDIQTANELKPDYIGFVFAPKSRRYVTPKRAAELRGLLDPGITAVGVFVNEAPKAVAELLDRGVIDIAQLHGTEDEEYISALRALTEQAADQGLSDRQPEQDILAAQTSTADYILLDSGNGGTGTCFDWSLIRRLERPYFLAGGLRVDNVGDAVAALDPYAVDVSSGIETGGVKDTNKMIEFVHAVRGVSGKED